MSVVGWRHWPDPGPVELPHALGSSGKFLLPGDGNFAAADAAAEILRRCVPWCAVITAPRIEDDHDVFGGIYVAEGGRGTVAVATGHGLRDAVRFAHHEVWHASEALMPAENVVIVAGLACRGRTWPDEYLSRPDERRARLYESWACARDEGWGPHVDAAGRAWTAVDQVCEHIYSGGLAAAVAEADAAEARKVSRAQARRRFWRRLRGGVRR